jgi:energy-coupling factor transporter ATP-binding protein EcfA2
MLRDGPILFDAVDRDAYAPRPELEAAILAAVRHGRGILLTGPSGSGRSTMLNWLARQLDREGERVARVDARMASDLDTALDLIEQGLHRPGGPVPALKPLREDLTQIVLAQERVRRLRAWPTTVVLLDNLADRGVIRSLFGGLRDLLWETGHRWVVTAHPGDRAKFLTPPADTFFADRIDIPSLTREELLALVRRHSEGLPFELEHDAYYPADVVRALLHPDRTPPSRSGVRGELGEQTAAVLDHVVALNRAVAADDEELIQRTGITATSLRRHLGRLRESGYLARVDENGGRPGRPRTLYLPASGQAEWE